jgi:hypothetical protein
MFKALKPSIFMKVMRMLGFNYRTAAQLGHLQQALAVNTVR